MVKQAIMIGLGVSLAAGTGCALVHEPLRTVWGTSTWHVESRRPNGVSFGVPQPWEDAYDAVSDAAAGAGMQVLRARREQRSLVLVHVPGSVATTQVGVFFSVGEPGGTRVEIASRSSHARDTVRDQLIEPLVQRGTREEH